MIEPTFSYAYVNFRRSPRQILIFFQKLAATQISVLVADFLQLVRTVLASLEVVARRVAYADYAPFALACNSCLVAYPSYVAALYSRNAIRLQLLNKLLIALYVVGKILVEFCLFSQRAVHPYAEYLAVSSVKKFCKLRFVKIVVRIGAVTLCVHIPGRKVYTHLKSVFFTACCKLADYISVAVLIRTVFYAVLGSLRLPQTKTVVMFCRDYNAFAARRLEYLAPLVGIEFFGIKLRRVFVALAPFFARHSIHTEVNEVVILHFHIVELSLRRRNAYKSVNLFALFVIAVVGIAATLEKFFSLFISLCGYFVIIVILTS